MTGNTVSPTPAQLWPIPVNGDDPDVPGDIASLARLIEKRVVGVYASTADRDAKAGPIVEEGMFAYTKDADKLWFYTGSAWTAFPPVQPAITSGTAGPSGGVDGDIYFKV